MARLTVPAPQAHGSASDRRPVACMLLFVIAPMFPRLMLSLRTREILLWEIRIDKASLRKGRYPHICIEDEFHYRRFLRFAGFPKKPARMSGGNGASKSSEMCARPLSIPSGRGPLGCCGKGTSRATGTPRFEITISSPAATRCKSWEKVVLALPTLTEVIVSLLNEVWLWSPFKRRRLLQTIGNQIPRRENALVVATYSSAIPAT